MNWNTILLSTLLIFPFGNAFCQNEATTSFSQKPILPLGIKPEKLIQAQHIIPAANRLDQYLPLLRGKKVGIFANQTSLVNNTHLVDTLTNLGIKITKIFGPEHGFRGTADAGANVSSYVDSKTGIPVVSLYGAKSHASAQDLKDCDILLFDLQDVGLRFYTYINSLQDFMESAIDNDKPLVILDRPNPNSFYIDGPVLDTAYRSGVGYQPIPIVYGMTIGEYAQMLIGEHWLKTNPRFENNQKLITIIPCENYDHSMLYQLPKQPSPNLKSMDAVYWYPSICLFEGTTLSEGRGTNAPFQIFGGPTLSPDQYRFTPIAQFGASSPKDKGIECYGWNLTLTAPKAEVDISWIIKAYQQTKDKKNFFLGNKSNDKALFFNKLVGNSILKKQIESGMSATAIKASWQPQLEKFKSIRKKYLLYKD